MLMQMKYVLICLLLALACSKPQASSADCDAGDGGITLPAGFCARVYADEVGVARHLVVNSNGDVFVALEDASGSSAGTTKMSGELARGGVLMLRDTTGDGRADVRIRFGERGGSGIALRNDTLFFSTTTTVYRYRVPANPVGEIGAPEIVADGFAAGGHSSRSLVLGDSNALFVNIGSDSNACREGDRGADPCAELDVRAGVWRFKADGKNQGYSDGLRFATGIRNAVGLAWNADQHALFATQHGRDALGNFRDHFSRSDNDDLPSEEFMRVERGDDFGWPYCYHDWKQGKRVRAPEYGGDGKSTDRCSDKKLPLLGFPGHWGPDGLLFYTGDMFPARYRDGAFIAFHGSWNRRKQDGYKVVFVPFRDGKPAGDWEVFADGFAGRRKAPGGARHRPVGLALAPDGSMYVTDDQRGRIWNVRYTRAN
jgi:glucose/arabinose dehydrogenase